MKDHFACGRARSQALSRSQRRSRLLECFPYLFLSLLLQLLTLSEAQQTASQPAQNNVTALLQTPQLPVFDLNAAWATALAAGPVSPSVIPPRAFRSSAFSMVGASIDRAALYMINVPAGLQRVAGNITVGPGQVLLLQGQGGLPNVPTDTDPVPRSVLVQPNTSSIALQPGAVVYFRNVTLIGIQFGPLNTVLSFVPAFVSPPPSNPRSAAVLYESVGFVFETCAALGDVQNTVCGLLTEDLDVPWPSAEIEPGWLMLYRLASARSNASIDLSMSSCSWPPPLLPSSPNWGSVSPANQPSAPPVKGTALYNASVLPLLASGFPVSAVPPLPANPMRDLPGVRAGTPPIQCVARRVLNAAELARAVVELQALSTRNVFVTIGTNMTWNDTGVGGDWPTSELALRIYRNVTLQGRHVLTARVTEIDLQNTLRNIFWIQPDTGYLRFQQLTLTNLPCGSRLFFPASLLVVMMWPVAWDRSQQETRTYVDVLNGTINIPVDNFNYTSYWVGIQASPIPQVRALANWQTALAFSGSLEVSADSHSLSIQRRWGRGIQWFNTTLTDLPVVAPLRFASLVCGLQNLVPGDPYYPYTKITPVFTGDELLASIANPPTPVLMLLDNITLSGNDTAVSVIRRYNASLDPTLTAIPLDFSGTNGTNATLPLAPNGPINFTRGPLTILGWRVGYTVLDLAGVVGRVQLQGARGPNPQPVITLKRMTLTGLGPADPSQRAGDLRNVTSSVWFFNFDRRQELLSLQNVTLVIPSTELGLVQSISNGSALPALGLGGGSLISPDASVFGALNQFESSWATARVRQSTPGTSLALVQVDYNGVTSLDLTLNNSLTPDLAAYLTTTPVPQGLTMPNSSSVFVVPVIAPTPTPPAADTGGGGGGLEPWQIAVLSVCCTIAIMLAGLLLWWVRKARRRAWKQQEYERQKLQDADKAPYAANSPRTPPSSGPMSGLTGWIDPRTGNQLQVVAHPEGAVAASALTNADRYSSVRTSWSHGHPSRTGSSPHDVGGPSGLGGPSSVIMRPWSGYGEITPVLSQGAPDEEIRQLVHTQRERSQARSGSGSKSLGQELEGVTLDSVLGQGSFGVVYLGRWRGMRVAVKTLMFHDSGPAARRARQRAVNEAAINTLLSHDCICNMYAYDLRPVAATGLPDERFSVNYRLYIIQEYCDAGSLAHAIDAGAFMDLGKRNLAAIIEVALQIARGLEYIHDNSVIHGDLSSGNVMLRTASDTPLGFQAKLCDFGLSRFLEGPEQSHISNARQGTPFYMAPEVLAHGIISREADVFSLGVILWELINATQPPWRDPAVVEKARQQFADLPRARPVLPSTQSGGAAGGEDTGSGTAIMDSSGTLDAIPFRPLLSLSGGSVSGINCPLPTECPRAYADMVAQCIHPIPKVRPPMSNVVSILQRLHKDICDTQSELGTMQVDLHPALSSPTSQVRARTISWGTVARRARDDELHGITAAANVMRPAQSAVLGTTYTIPEALGSPASSGGAPFSQLVAQAPGLPQAAEPAAEPGKAGLDAEGRATLQRADTQESRPASCPPASPERLLGTGRSSSLPVVQQHMSSAPPVLTLFSEPGSTSGERVQQGPPVAYMHVFQPQHESGLSHGTSTKTGQFSAMGTTDLFDSVDLPSAALNHLAGVTGLP